MMVGRVATIYLAYPIVITSTFRQLFIQLPPVFSPRFLAFSGRLRNRIRPHQSRAWIIPDNENPLN